MNQKGTADEVAMAVDVIEDSTADEITVAADIPAVDIVIHHE